MIAISTAFAFSLVAIDINGKKDFVELDSSCKQSEKILATIDEVLQRNDLTIGDNKDFCVVIGPGSFTGLRIGIALVKGLCAGLDNTKVVGLSSLDFMAYEYVKQDKPKDNFVCVLNALSGLYFVCEYDCNGHKVGSERLIDNDEFASIKIEKIGLQGENIVERSIKLTAKGLLDLAELKMKNKETSDIKSLSPIYLRKSQAEASLEEKNLKKN